MSSAEWPSSYKVANSGRKEHIPGEIAEQLVRLYRPVSASCLSLTTRIWSSATNAVHGTIFSAWINVLTLAYLTLGAVYASGCLFLREIRHPGCLFLGVPIFTWHRNSKRWTVSQEWVTPILMNPHHPPSPVQIVFLRINSFLPRNKWPPAHMHSCMRQRHDKEVHTKECKKEQKSVKCADTSKQSYVRLDSLRITQQGWAWERVAWYPARRKSPWYTLMRFRLIKNGAAHAYDVYTV